MPCSARRRFPVPAGTCDLRSATHEIISELNQATISLGCLLAALDGADDILVAAGMDLPVDRLDAQVISSVPDRLARFGAILEAAKLRATSLSWRAGWAAEDGSGLEDLP
jgi:hypothetical protein